MVRFSFKFFSFTLLLFIVEVFIALYIHDRFVRPYLGDYIVVFLIYCFIRTFLKASPLTVVIGVLLFAYFVELLQYLRIVDRLGLTDNLLAKTVIGYGFEWLDMLAYTLGAVTILLLETVSRRKISGGKT